MKNNVLGQLKRDGNTLYVAEPEANLGPEAESFKVNVGINGAEFPMDLNALRQMKLLLAEGERLLVTRERQAVLRRNYVFDF